MVKHLVCTIAALWSVSSFAIGNDSYYTGQTGQYHHVPTITDVQKITLVGYPSADCQSPSVTLFAVNEYGTKEPIPFKVPARTVFTVTDAEFTGFQNAQVSGKSAWLHVVSNVPNTFERASFMSNKRLSGLPFEPFEGQGSLNSGGSFATGSILCARPGLSADGQASVYNMEFDSVTVHGTLVDNVLSDTFPYITW